MIRTLRNTEQGSGFAGLYSAAEIRRLEYRALCFEQAHLVDKLCFGWRGGDRLLIISFYRSRSDLPYAIERFAGLADITLSALTRSLNASERPAAVPLAERLELRLSLQFDQLSPRERQICALTLAGVTADEIAVRLDIRRSRVLTYRQRAYQRYGFTRSSDFLDVLVD